jgi:diamine N-acetyltransferase
MYYAICKKLEGEFVNLRPLKILDAELTNSWRHAPRAKYLGQSAESVEQQASWIASRPDSEYNFLIELKTGHPIGMISLIAIDTVNRHAESGRFLIGDQAAAKGVPAAVEAMKLIYELAFEKLALVRVCGIIAANNTMMIKWQKYLGMREEGCLRNHLCLKNGFFEDAVYLGILVEEYYKIALPRMKVLIAAARTK